MALSGLVALASLGALLLGAATTLFSCSPLSELDAAAVLQLGGPSFFGGLLGASRAHRLWQVKRPRAVRSGAEPSALLEVAWTVGLAVCASVAVWLLVGALPWSVAPRSFYGPYYAVEVVPLTVTLRLLVSLLAIRQMPRLAALFLSRQLVKPRAVSALATLSALAAAILAYRDSETLLIMPYGLLFATVDVALALTLVVVAIDSFDAAQPAAS